MKVVISAGGRFHAFRLAEQLKKHGHLKKLYTFTAQQSDFKTLQPGTISNSNSCKLLNAAILRLRLARIINPSYLNMIKDNLFDLIVARSAKKLKQVDIFVGWANYSLNTIPIMKAHGATIIIESGSCHIKKQQLLLEQEYKKWNIPFKPIREEVVSKMTAEYNAADYIMTLSTFARNSFIEMGIAKEKILMVPCSSDVEYFMQSDKPKKNDVKFRAIFVGLASLRKGLPYLINAWKIANLPENQTELIIVGNMQKDMRAWLKQNSIKKNITFFGSTNRKTLKQLYQNSNIFILPSIEDGFGMVMGEAMASGLPIVCSTHTGAPDLIQDGKHGFIVPAGNSLELSNKISWLYNNPVQAISMGQHGQQHIHKFSWKAYGEAVIRCYKKILNHDS